MLPIVTMELRLAAEPELRYLPDGTPVCSFRAVCQDRKQNPQTSQWEDAGEPMWVRVTAWRTLAENCAESLAKGDLVLVSGKLSTRTYTSNEGAERMAVELDARQVGAALQFRSIAHSGSSGNGRARPAQAQRPQQAPQRQGPAAPWADRGQPEAESVPDPWASAATDDLAPPF